ncbi:MAG: type 2 isopentenyl-diphosphate Delta-isomerase [Candidatus Thermoplasmatota archaeon]|nr:type 2 isopentenyl-diphosphate Delta-isomerase [Candidatus Thermoplasmatota archaeon]
MTIDGRKNDHIDICLSERVRVSKDHWDEVHLVHQAIPSCDLEDIDLAVDFLGKELSAPLIISAMTGGSDQAQEYNRILARAAEEFGIGLGVGSQRAGLEKASLEGSYSVIKEFNVPLVLGNLGAPQFSDSRGKGISRYSLEDVARALQMINGDAICLHLNYLQEVVQPEGETHICGFLDNLGDLTKEVKVVAKETGAGISRKAALSLKEAGVAAIDVGGASGTSFSAVESYRDSGGSGRAKRIGTTYWDWGIPTPVSLKLANVGLPLIATGGLRNGQDVVKAISLGADIGGMAWPLLSAASKGFAELKREISFIIEEIRIGLFLTGCRSAADIVRPESVITGHTGEYLEFLSRY